jgi:Arc/MetJ family transcription regulator
MNDKADKEFAELALKTIAPWAESWPDDLLHFQLMKAAVMEDRETVRKALTAMVKADGDPNLSLKGKEEQRRKIRSKQLLSSMHRASVRRRGRVMTPSWRNGATWSPAS